MTELTRAGVEDYNRRLEQPEILKCLTRENIEDQAQSGKVSFGVIYGEKEADFQKAADNAIQCFEDGIYRVFAGGEELTELSGEIAWTDDLVFTFIRLTMLAGG